MKTGVSGVSIEQARRRTVAIESEVDSGLLEFSSKRVMTFHLALTASGVTLTLIGNCVKSA